MRINHNIAALNTYRQLNSASTGQAKSMEKLSSGLRINRAGDDAAGLAISEKMRGQIRGLEMGSKNAQDGISLIQTAEGALNETHSILQRMRELAVQSSNDTSTDADRSEIQKEVAQLKEEIDRISSTTEFNTKKLLNGDLAGGKVAQGTKLESVAVNAGGSTDVSSATATADAFEITSSNNTFKFSVASSVDSGSDGTAAEVFNISLTEGKYTLDELKTELQSKMNEALSGATDTDLQSVSITVDDDGAGKITFATDASTTTLTLTDGDAGTFEDTLGLTADKTIDDDPAVAMDDAATATDGLYEIANSAQIDVTFGTTSKSFVLNSTGSAKVMSDAEIVATINDQIKNDASIAGKFGASLDTNGKLVFTSYESDKSLTVDASALTEKLGATDDDTTDNTTGSAETTLLTAMRDSEGNEFGLQNGDIIKINGKVSGSAVTETTLTIGTDTTIANLTAKIEETFGLDSGSVSINSDGEFQVLGEDGTANALSDLKLSAENRTLFNNKFSSFRETQEAQDKNVDSSLSFQIGSNEGQTMKVDINEISTQSLALSSVDVSTQQGSQTAVSVINAAIEEVSTERSKLGAFQNRLEHTINNLGTSAENLTAAESRVRDVDMAKEMMNQTKNSILSQAAQAMLAQANQQPQGVLQLLR